MVLFPYKLIVFALFCVSSFGEFVWSLSDDNEMADRSLTSNILRTKLNHLLPGTHLEDLKKEAKLKEDANPSVHFLDKEDTFVRMNGTNIAIRDQDLVKIKIFADNAVSTLDGIPAASHPSVWKSKMDPSITITKTESGDIDSIVKDGIEELVEVEPHMFAEFGLGDQVDNALQEFHFMSIDPPMDDDEDDDEDVDEEDHTLHGQQRDMLVQDLTGQGQSLGSIDEPHRGLRGRCTSYHIIPLTIIIDSSFCAREGGFRRVEDHAASIVAKASDFFEEICVKLRIIDMHRFCNARTDPIRRLIARAGPGNVCNNENGLLQQFGAFVKQKKEDKTLLIRGAAVHLFHGFNLDPTRKNVVGCAYRGTVCRLNGGKNTGVNEMSFNRFIHARSLLLAHELGHTFGARHVDDKFRGGVMFKAMCSNCKKAFRDESKAAIQNKLNAILPVCLRRLNAANSITNQNNANRPTTAPSGSPSMAPSESPSMTPSKYPSMLPSLYPSKAPTESPTDEPVTGTLNTWEVLAAENFDNGFGTFTAGSQRYARVSGDYVYQGQGSLRLSSLSYATTSRAYTFEKGSKYRLSYHFLGVGLRRPGRGGRRKEYLMVEVAMSPSTNFTPLKVYTYGSGIFKRNRRWYFEELESSTLPFDTTVYFRFRSRVRSRFRHVCIDQVRIEKLRG